MTEDVRELEQPLKRPNHYLLIRIQAGGQGFDLRRRSKLNSTTAGCLFGWSEKERID